MIIETKIHPKRVTDWRAFCSGGIFFENEAGHAEIVNGKPDRNIINNIRFQHDRPFSDEFTEVADLRQQDHDY